VTLRKTKCRAARPKNWRLFGRSNVLKQSPSERTLETMQSTQQGGYDSLLKNARECAFKGQFGFVWEHQAVFALDFCRKLRKGMVSDAVGCIFRISLWCSEILLYSFDGFAFIESRLTFSLSACLRFQINLNLIKFTSWQ